MYSLKQMNFTIGNVLQGLIGAFLVYTAVRALMYHSSILKTAGKIISGIMIVAGVYMMYSAYKSASTPEVFFGAGRRKY
jgi:prolipoprotein diacylglyceryltransferase